MDRRVLPFFVLALVFIAPVTYAEPTTGNRVFFDDFVTSGFPAQWTNACFFAANCSPSGSAGNITQNGGYLSIRDQGPIASSTTINSIVGNQSGPMLDSLLPNNPQFRQITWKMQAFNVTSPTVSPPGEQIIADLQFGLGTCACGGITTNFPTGFWFELLESPVNLNSVFSFLPAMKQAAYFAVRAPTTTTTPRFLIDWTGQVVNNASLYNSGNANFDLNQQHIFTTQLMMDPLNMTNDWVKWNIDGNAVMQYQQSSCSCIFGAASDVRSLYPFMTLSYSIRGSQPPPLFVSQSLGTFVDYVYVWNSPVDSANLPQGQILSSNIIPPHTNQGLSGVGGQFSLSQYMQYTAWQAGQGNVYAGGILLMGLFLLILSSGLGVVVYKLRLGFGIFGMIWDILALGLVFFFYLVGIIPLLYPALVTVGAIAIMFGIVKQHPPGAGGVVPD